MVKKSYHAPKIQLAELKLVDIPCSGSKQDSTPVSCSKHKFLFKKKFA